MSASLTLDEHLAAVEVSGGQLAGFARQAGLDARVPTCPAWTVDTLVAHQAMVHRWATAHVRGDEPDAVLTQTQVLETVPDLVRYSTRVWAV